MTDLLVSAYVAVAAVGGAKYVGQSDCRIVAALVSAVRIEDSVIDRAGGRANRQDRRSDTRLHRDQDPRKQLNCGPE